MHPLALENQSERAVTLFRWHGSLPRRRYRSRRQSQSLLVNADAPPDNVHQAGLDPIPDQIALELRQAGHDGAHQLAADGAEIEAEARMSQDANFPAVQVVAGLNEALSFCGSTHARAHETATQTH